MYAYLADLPSNRDGHDNELCHTNRAAQHDYNVKDSQNTYLTVAPSPQNTSELSASRGNGSDVLENGHVLGRLRVGLERG